MKEQLECNFCSLHTHPSIPWQNDIFYATFDAYPVSPGHTLLIPKRHVLGLTDLTSEEWMNLKLAIKVVINLIETADLRPVYESFIANPFSTQTERFCRKALEHPRFSTKPDGYNHGINDGRAAGRTVDHLHWHIIPRYLGDMEDPRGGVRYVIPEMGNYKVLKGYYKQ